MIRTRLGIVAFTMLASCGEGAAPVPSAIETGSAAAVATASLPTATPSAATESTRADSDAREVTLMTNGILLVGAVDGQGTATTLTFGQDRKLVLDVLSEEFAKPRLEHNGECGAGPMDFARYGRLTLNFAEEKFVGWLADGGDNLVTVDGIRPGDTLAKIQREREAHRIEGTTLEGEFEYAASDGTMMGGVLSGNGDAARVESLYAGTTCFFR